MTSSGGRRQLRILTALLLLLTSAATKPRDKLSWISPRSACDEHHTLTSSSSSSSSTFAGQAQPPFPELPRRYSVRVEANIVQKQWTTEVLEYYDGVEGMAAVLLTFNGTTTKSIFNFQNQEKYVIFENGSCRTESIKYDVFGFSRFSQMGRPAMATVNEVFRMGAGFNQTYVGKDTVRGITVDHWTSCQEWPEVGAWYQLDYYFSEADYTTASSRVQIPVRAVVDGSARNTNPTRGTFQASHEFYHIYDFTSFRSGPFSDEGVFRIPRGVVCFDRVNTRPLPALPNQFEMDVEVIISGRQGLSRQESIVYDTVHGVMQTSRLLTGLSDTNKKMESITVTAVEDFVNQIIFVINEHNNSCSVHRMKNDFRQADLSHRMSLFEMANEAKDYVYQGKTKLRDMLVDVWGWSDQVVNQEIYFLDSGKETEFGDRNSSAALKFMMPMGMSFRKKMGATPDDYAMILKYISSSYLDDPNDNTDDELSSTRNTTKELLGDQIVMELQILNFIESFVEEKMVNFFHFNPSYALDKSFDVTRCFPSEETKLVLVSVNASLKSDREISVEEFTHAMHTAIVNSAGLSFLQLKYEFYYEVDKGDNTSTYFYFTLLGTPSGTKASLMPLKRANEALQNALQRGISFQIQLSNRSKTFSLDKCAEWSSMFHDDFYPKNNKDSPQAYSPQAVAGVAIATFILGACLCFVIIYILYKRRHPGQAFMFYKMTQ